MKIFSFIKRTIEIKTLVFQLVTLNIEDFMEIAAINL